MTWTNVNVLGDIMRINAEERPDKVAFIDSHDKTSTFKVFNQRVNQLNHALATLGLKKGARVAILAASRPEYIEVYGVAKSGLVAVPLNWRLSPAEIIKLIHHSEPEVMIADSSYADMVDAMRDQIPSVKHFILMDTEKTGWTQYESLLASAASDEPTTLVVPDDVLCIIYTSGTTGAPKGVAMTHRSVTNNVHGVAVNMLKFTTDDISLAAMPLFHIGGMWLHLFPSYAAGCTTIVLPVFDIPIVLKEIERWRITNIHAVPTLIGSLINHPALPESDHSSLRLIYYAASSMPADLLRRAMQAFPGSGFIQGYGCTEGGGITCLTPEDHLLAKDPAMEKLLLSCGHPLPGRECLLVDDHNQPVAQGQIGEVMMKSQGVMKGYWQDPVTTTKVLRDGFYKTGDIAYYDAEGYLYIVDRKNDMVVTGGENVYPNEVEQALYENQNILEAAVFGVPDPKWVERVVAAVVLRPNAVTTTDEIIAQLREKLAAYKCPKQIYLVNELPKNGIGKILRKNLRNEYANVETP